MDKVYLNIANENHEVKQESISNFFGRWCSYGNNTSEENNIKNNEKHKENRMFVRTKSKLTIVRKASSSNTKKPSNNFKNNIKPSSTQKQFKKPGFKTRKPNTGMTRKPTFNRFEKHKQNNKPNNTERVINPPIKMDTKGVIITKLNGDVFKHTDGRQSYPYLKNISLEFLEYTDDKSGTKKVLPITWHPLKKVYKGGNKERLATPTLPVVDVVVENGVAKKTVTSLDAYIVTFKYRNDYTVKLPIRIKSVFKQVDGDTIVNLNYEYCIPHIYHNGYRIMYNKNSNVKSKVLISYPTFKEITNYVKERVKVIGVTFDTYTY